MDEASSATAATAMSADSGNLRAVSPCFIVENFGASIAYYRDRLGFEVEYQGPADNPFFAIVRRDGVRIMLKAISPAVQPQPNHTRHKWARLDAYVYTTDPDVLFEEFTRRGASFVTQLSFIDDGLWGFEVADADGYVIAFARVRND